MNHRRPGDRPVAQTSPTSDLSRGSQEIDQASPLSTRKATTSEPILNVFIWVFVSVELNYEVGGREMRSSSETVWDPVDLTG